MFYEQLQKACKKKKTSVTAMLKAIGVSTSNGTYWKNGSAPTIDMIVKISEFLNVSCDYLLTGKESIQAVELSKDEQDLLSEYKKLDFKGRSAVMSVIVSEQERMKSEKNTNRDTKIG